MSRGKSAFYAVRHGHKTGIFTTWSDTQASVNGFSGAEHRKFARKEDAEAWLNPQELKREREPVPVDEPVNKKQRLPAVTTVYCDGSCLGNGTVQARAGVGVWFGSADKRNLSEPLPSTIAGPHSNQKAELWAAIRALQCLDASEATVLCTDSQYALKSATEWRHRWIRQRWNVQLTNLPLHRQLSDLMEARKASTEWHHVDAHTGIEGNEAADQLAKRAAEAV